MQKPEGPVHVTVKVEQELLKREEMEILFKYFQDGIDALFKDMKRPAPTVAAIVCLEEMTGNPSGFADPRLERGLVGAAMIETGKALKTVPPPGKGGNGDVPQ